MNTDKIIFIVGPTAVGKSDVAFNLAQKIRGEIISCDSMQIYKGINIASNKPSMNSLNNIPHHLVDIRSVEMEFDVAQFNQLTISALEEIFRKNHVPIVVGGSGLYMQILLDGIFKGGSKNEALRKDLNEQARQRGNQYLYDELKQEDPRAAEKIHPNDIRRVVRALEIYRTEQIPISKLQKDRKGLWGNYDISLYCLDRQRPELYDRINRRVEQMFQEGIIDEIKSINGVLWSQTAGKIIGIQEVRKYLSGECSLEETKEQIKLNTRHLAKRQLTWFRREKRLHWIMIADEDTSESIAEVIVHESEMQNKIGLL